VDASITSQPAIGGQCSDGFSPCGKGDGLRCYDLSRSEEHCGACGQVCALGIACQAGVCQQSHCKGALSFKSLFTSTGDIMAVGDFDGAGILDLIGSPGDSMSILYGAGDGTFPTHQDIESAAILGWQARAADLDQDGFLDLISIDSLPMGTSTNGTVKVRRGSGNRSAPFGQPAAYPTTSSVLSGLL